MSGSGLGGRGRRFVRLLLRRRKEPVAAEDLDEAELSFRHIWRYVKLTGSVRYPPKRSRQNLLVLQMGKVASLAIHQALNEAGINAFHTHSLSIADQERTLRQLFTRDFTFRLASHELRYQMHNIALGMLVRWYRTHQRYDGRKLKVITLTRDPTTRYASSVVQRLPLLLPGVCAWQNARLGEAADAAAKRGRAVHDLVVEVASIIAEAGAENAEACQALARRRWPGHPIVAEEARNWLRPLTWLDTEIAGIFGLDVLAQPELRERGWVELQNEWVEIFALRFEHLSAILPRMGEFAGLAGLTLRQRNVTSRKSGAADYLAAMQAAIETPVGQACVRALRASAYARACGYDAPEQWRIAAVTS